MKKEKNLFGFSHSKNIANFEVIRMEFFIGHKTMKL